MIIIFDGPEKVGKTTIINALAKWLTDDNMAVKILKWGPVDPDDRVYTPALQECARSPGEIFIWDRSWASEHVYALLLNRNRRLRLDPWLGEWLHGRAVTPNGLLYMVLPPFQSDAFIRDRDSTDLDVDPNVETALFSHYADRFSWRKILGTRNTSWLNNTVKSIIGDIMKKFSECTPYSYGINYTDPNLFAGPANASVLFVGESPSSGESIPGSWLPFTSRLTTKLGRTLGDGAMQCGWTNASVADPRWLSFRKVVVSCGRVAQKWVEKHADWKTSKILCIPHPSWLYRYNNERTITERDRIQSIIAENVLSELLRNPVQL